MTAVIGRLPTFRAFQRFVVTYLSRARLIFSWRSIFLRENKQLHHMQLQVRKLGLASSGFSAKGKFFIWGSFGTMFADIGQLKDAYLG